MKEHVSHQFVGELTEVLSCVEMLCFALNNAKIRTFRGKEWFGMSSRHSFLL